MNPKISILMPVYNGEKYLREAIDSVLSQTYTDFELIMLNNHSNDSTLSIMQSYTDPRIVIINNEENKGLIGSLNIGLYRCRGKYTARLDHDDIALPDRLKTQYEFMESHPDIDLVGSWTECINRQGEYMKISRNPENRWSIRYELLFNNVMFHSSIFFKTKLIQDNGGYSFDFTHSEDYELYSRPNKELNCTNIQRVLFKLRIHDESITGSDGTQAIVHVNALNVAYRNITQYIKLSRADFDYLKRVLIIKRPDKDISISMLIKALVILRRVTNSFLNKNNIPTINRNIVLKHYKGRRRMMIQHYLIGRYRSIFHG